MFCGWGGLVPALFGVLEHLSGSDVDVCDDSALSVCPLPHTTASKSSVFVSARG